MKRQTGWPFDPRALREIAEGTSADIVEAFFDALVRHLARAMGTKCAWVTEWLPDTRSLRALAFWAGNGYVRDFEYAVADTPCEPVVEDRRLVFVPDRIVELYARDEALEPLGAVSYLGVPLLDLDGSVLGHLAVLDDEPMTESDSALAVFRIFANRAAAELRRLRSDRALREREQKLSRLFDGAIDAIVEFDESFRITTLNTAAATTFGHPGTELVGEPLDRLLAPESCDKLRQLVGELGRHSEGPSSLWIPEGLEGLLIDGSRFPADATVSCYRQAGSTFHLLILRNVHDRLEAEARIRSLTGEAAYLRAELDALHGFDEIVGQSASLRRVLADVERVAATDAAVLITGETGTGKELIARAVHRLSRRSTRPLIAVNCAAVPANLQESEFFGHEKGAFTGALQRRDGRFKLADGGTIFLDEIGEMGKELQAKLLRVLQEGEFEPVGSSRTVRVDVRIVAATNRDVEKMVQEGAFRADLMYRLNVFPIHLPPLRQRDDDVVILAERFAADLGRKLGRTPAPFTPEMKERLRRYEWPGNVRELRNVVERAFITAQDGRTLDFERALPDGVRSVASESTEPGNDRRVLTATELKDMERGNIERALAAANGKVSGPRGAAELLGINPNTLAARMKALGIRRPSGAEFS